MYRAAVEVFIADRRHVFGGSTCPICAAPGLTAPVPFAGLMATVDE
ncbi:MAG: hypothetical protein AVDCRST_MAG71-810 [uncultured Lysobacter sp.]|uniref:Uncharacterized protein n=1 Tax=uncultured Lysobacter sp. TaxID=271060 RepID=A0A6J4KR23_9GAMM|nr:MAG: hypothetical protein AVDCRST_MAG71-810 [uncultured Lysobacter sp.]